MPHDIIDNQTIKLVDIIKQTLPATHCWPGRSSAWRPTCLATWRRSKGAASSCRTKQRCTRIGTRWRGIAQSAWGRLPSRSAHLLRAAA